VRHALLAASEALANAGIRHALVGGLAVGAYGEPRATEDVDFLVGEEAFIAHAAGVVTLRPEVPYHVGGVKIDTVPATDLPFINLDDELANAEESEGVPVIRKEVLIAMKLTAWRRHDRHDVEMMLEGDASLAAAVAAYLEERRAAAPRLIDDLLERLEEAEG
jgi:hypothetical protein